MDNKWITMVLCSIVGPDDVIQNGRRHYNDVKVGAVASQITSLTIVYSTVYSGANQRKHQSSASLVFVWGIHRGRWIPRTKGQQRGKCFHLMTSSWTSLGTFSLKLPYHLVYLHKLLLHPCHMFCGRVLDHNILSDTGVIQYNYGTVQTQTSVTLIRNRLNMN